MSYFWQVECKNTSIGKYMYMYLYGLYHMEIHRAEEMERTEQGDRSWID